MSDIEKLRKQLKDVTDLYDKERVKSSHLEATLNSLKRREPLVQMLWQECQLLRKLLERYIPNYNVVADLPTGRLDKNKSNITMNDRDRLAVMALKSIQDGQIYDNEFAINPFKRKEEEDTWLKRGVNGGMDPLNSEIINSQNRVDQLNQLNKNNNNVYIPVAAANSPWGVSIDPTNGIPYYWHRTTQGVQWERPDDFIEDVSNKNDIPPPPSMENLNNNNNNNSSIPQAPDLFGSSNNSNIPEAPDLFGDGPKKSNNNGIPEAPDLFGDSSNNNNGIPDLDFDFEEDLGPQPTKPMIKPKGKMKPLHWQSIIIGEKNKRNQVSSKSIWVDIESIYNSFINKIDKTDFETKFSGAPVKKQKVTDENDTDNKNNKNVNKATEVTTQQRLLEPKRHDAMTIMLAKMPKFDVLYKAILSLDNNVLTIDKIDALQRSMPTQEEIQIVLDSGYKSEQLFLPEQFILYMNKIPQLSARIECWHFSIHFEDLFITVHKPLARIEAACNQIKESKLFKQILGLILTYGNYMNGGTPRGQADGFHLDTFSKLIRVKDVDGNMSLLDYIIIKCIEMYGEEFPEKLSQELNLIEEVKQYSIKQLSNDGRKLQNKTNLNIKMQSLVAAQITDKNDPFDDVMTKFNENASLKVKNLENRCKSVYNNYVDLILYLQPDLDTAKAESYDSEEFFTVIFEFIQFINNCAKTLKDKKEAEERKIKQAQHLSELKNSLKKKVIENKDDKEKKPKVSETA